MSKLNYFIKSVFLIFVCSFFFNSSVYGQCMWEVVSPKSGKTSYIFGTLHHPEKQITPHLKDHFWDYWEQTDVFVGEIKEVEESDQYLNNLQKKMTLPEGKDISNFLSEKEYDSLNRFIEIKHPSHKQTFHTYYPIYTSIAIVNHSIADAVLLDSYLQKEAIHQKKKVVGLEREIALLELFNSISWDSQINQLRFTLDKDSSYWNIRDRLLIESYIKEDIERIEELTITDMTEESNEKIIVSRNQEMVKVLTQILSAQRCFVAIGVGHLAGNNGIISLLRERGFILSPIKIFNP